MAKKVFQVPFEILSNWSHLESHGQTQQFFHEIFIFHLLFAHYINNLYPRYFLPLNTSQIWLILSCPLGLITSSF